MIINYLKLSFRQLLKQRSFTLINLAGLSVGLIVAILIFLWIRDELQFDQFHDDANRIYRLSWHAKYGANEWNIPIIPVPVGPTLEQEFPEVEYATQWLSTETTFQKGNEYIREVQGAFVDNNFFKIFTTNFTQGHLDQALENPNSIVISRSMASRYFPQMDATGQNNDR